MEWIGYSSELCNNMLWNIIPFHLSVQILPVAFRNSHFESKDCLATHLGKFVLYWTLSTGVKGNIQIFEYCKYQSTYAPLQLGDSFLLGSLPHWFPISAAGSTERDVCKWTFTLGPGPNVIRSKYTRKLVENRHPNSQIICVLSCIDSQTVVRL